MVKSFVEFENLNFAVQGEVVWGRLAFNARIRQWPKQEAERKVC